MNIQLGKTELYAMESMNHEEPLVKIAKERTGTIMIGTIYSTGGDCDERRDEA